MTSATPRRQRHGTQGKGQNDAPGSSPLDAAALTSLEGRWLERR